MLVVLQPTSLCNLNCRYCYVPNRRSADVMSPEVLEAAIAGAFRSSCDGWVEFLWHAGEPLSVGLPFYREAVRLIEAYRPAGLEVVNTVQTNGTLIDDTWAAFFRDHDFHVCVSIDGPADLHDRDRRNWSGKGSHAAALRGVECLRRAGMSPTALFVVTRESLGRAAEILSFFQEAGFSSIGFNVEEIENAHAFSSLSLAGEGRNDVLPRFRDFVADLFDAWWPCRDQITIREFRDVISFIRNHHRDPGHCRHPDESKAKGIVTIQKTGDVSTFSPELAGAVAPAYGNFVIGNILREDLAAMWESEAHRALLAEVDASRVECRERCGYFDACGGAFLSNRFFETGRLGGSESTACILHKKIVTAVVVDRLVGLSEGGVAA